MEPVLRAPWCVLERASPGVGAEGVQSVLVLWSALVDALVLGAQQTGKGLGLRISTFVNTHQRANARSVTVRLAREERTALRCTTYTRTVRSPRGLTLLLIIVFLCRAPPRGSHHCHQADSDLPSMLKTKRSRPRGAALLRAQGRRRGKALSQHPPDCSLGAQALSLGARTVSQSLVTRAPAASA